MINPRQGELRKTRNISSYELLIALQKEYVCFEIRSKIYSRVSEKEDYKAKMAHKKIKILDISDRNDLPTIFTEGSSIYSDIRYEILGDMGVPNFIYSDDKIKGKFFQRDLEAYFSIGSDVKIFSDGDESKFKIGKIEDYDFDSETIICSVDNQEISIEEGLVSRIL